MLEKDEILKKEFSQIMIFIYMYLMKVWTAT